jgi:hypothetical protein
VGRAVPAGGRAIIENVGREGISLLARNKRDDLLAAKHGKGLLDPRQFVALAIEQGEDLHSIGIVAADDLRRLGKPYLAVGLSGSEGFSDDQ